MEPSSFVKKLSKKFYPLLRRTYLEKSDLEQETRVALIVAKNKNCDLFQYVKKHLSVVIQQTEIKEEQLLESFSNKEQPIDYIMQIESKKRLMMILRTLIERCTTEQKIVLKLIYGLLDGKCRNYNEVAIMFKLPVQRIKEIEKEALVTLRNQQGLGQVRSKYTF